MLNVSGVDEGNDGEGKKDDDAVASLTVRIMVMMFSCENESLGTNVTASAVMSPSFRSKTAAPPSVEFNWTLITDCEGVNEIDMLAVAFDDGDVIT